MSIIDGALEESIEQFGGAKPILDPIDLAKGEAAVALNCEFFPKRVQTRRGFTSVFSPNQAIQSIKYWNQDQPGAQTPYLIYLHDTTTVTIRNQNTGVTTDILTGLSGANAAIFAPWTSRMYMAQLNSSALGNGGGFVWDGNVAHTMDNVFQRPMLTTEVTLTLQTPSTGVITQGTHLVGVLFQTRNGYWTKPGPASAVSSIGVTLSPATLTASGATNVQATLTPATTWPTWIQNIQIIFTSALNQFQYYVVPGTITPVTAGSSTPVTVTWNVNDLQLRSIGSQGAGTLADQYFSQISMDGSNNPPFNPKFVIAWGQRLVWFGNFGGVDSFFPSDPLNPELITANNHIQQLPNAIPISTAFVLRGILYVLSTVGGIFAYYDNGLKPVQFAPPQTIDDSIATAAPLGVTVDDTGSGYALISAQQGMFIFPGLAVPDIPLSYYSGPDWDLIDWTQPLALIVKIHQQDRLFLVKAPLTTGGTEIFTFNYLNGRTPEAIKYSSWTIGGSYPLGPIEIVLNPTKKVWEIYIAPSVAGAGNAVGRQKAVKGGDSLATIYQDFTSTAIDWRYTPAPLPENEPGGMLNHIALRLRVASITGSASNFYVAVNSLDNTRSIIPVGVPFSIVGAPDAHTLIPYDFQNEAAFYTFSNSLSPSFGGTTNHALAVTWFQHFYTDMAAHR